MGLPASRSETVTFARTETGRCFDFRLPTRRSAQSKRVKSQCPDGFDLFNPWGLALRCGSYENLKSGGAVGCRKLVSLLIVPPSACSGGVLQP